MSDEVDAAAGGGAHFLGAHERALLARVEDAGLNASAPPQQRWMDGWLVRTSPGKAQRARCINAVAPGRQPVAKKLADCTALYASLGLPMLVRITPFSEPPTLDSELAARGYAHHDDTRVMVLSDMAAAVLDLRAPSPEGFAWAELPSAAFAEAVGAIRSSTPEARRAHTERLASSPVPYRGFALLRDGQVAACGQIAQEGDLVGLYDIATARASQRLGLGSWLCKRLLTVALTTTNARSAYLQVGADNHGARRIYTQLGFSDAYSYHYRMRIAQ